MEEGLDGSVVGRRGWRCCARHRGPALRRDLVAGTVLAALLVPQGMAYAELAGLPPVTGLYATLVPLVVYFLLGPSPILVLGPDSAVAPLVAAAIVPLAAAGDASERIALAGLLAILVGAIMFAGGLARFGFVTELLSLPVAPRLPHGHRRDGHRRAAAQALRLLGRRRELRARRDRLRLRPRRDQRDRARARRRIARADARPASLGAPGAGRLHRGRRRHGDRRRAGPRRSRGGGRLRPRRPAARSDSPTSRSPTSRRSFPPRSGSRSSRSPTRACCRAATRAGSTSTSTRTASSGSSGSPMSPPGSRRASRSPRAARAPRSPRTSARRVSSRGSPARPSSRCC